MNTTLRAGVFDQLTTLSDPTRSRLLHVLQDRELTVTELCSVLQLPQSTVSRHLKILSDDGWVTSRADGVLSERRTRSQEFFSSVAGQWDAVRNDLFGERSPLVGLMALIDPSWL